MAEQTIPRDAPAAQEETRNALQSAEAQALSRQMERESRRYPIKFTQ